MNHHIEMARRLRIDHYKLETKSPAFIIKVASSCVSLSCGHLIEVVTNGISVYFVVSKVLILEVFSPWNLTFHQTNDIF
jgi:hypothetical protein